jgi:hypothetical protein
MDTAPLDDERPSSHAAPGQPPAIAVAEPPPFATVPVLVVAVVLAAVLTALSGRYGFHRDELYFLVAGHHPAWGYVDQPPLTPLLARGSTAVFGDTTYGLRAVATLACGAIVVVTAAVARETGGGRGAQTLAAGCAATSGYVLANGHMVSTSGFDLLAWLVITWAVLRLLRTGDGRWWVVAGAAAGVAVENKYLVVLLPLALLPALFVVGPREALRTGWLPVGCVVALLIAAPNLWWQATHGWPQFTVAGGISSDDGTENRVLFVPEQLVYLSPVYVPLWVAGGLRLWRGRDPATRGLRALAPGYLLLCVLVLATGGKPYYALPLLLVLLAAGCEPTVRWLRRGRRRARTAVLSAGVVLATVTSAVVGLPVLPRSAVGVAAAVNPEQAEQIGWPSLVDAVAKGWSDIPEGQRGHAVVLAQNYGEAGAIAMFGPERGLPAPYSGHMSFADWGPPPDSATGPVLLIEQDGSRDLDRHFRGCRTAARVGEGGVDKVDNQEWNASVMLCSPPTERWSRLWPALRRFY